MKSYTPDDGTAPHAPLSMRHINIYTNIDGIKMKFVSLYIESRI